MCAAGKMGVGGLHYAVLAIKVIPYHRRCLGTLTASMHSALIRRVLNLLWCAQAQQSRRVKALSANRPMHACPFLFRLRSPRGPHAQALLSQVGADAASKLSEDLMAAALDLQMVGGGVGGKATGLLWHESPVVYCLVGRQ